MLNVSNLNAGYGDIQVLWNISLQVDVGETIALIGPNGAGKSTLLNCVCGLLPTPKGSVQLDGKDLSSVPGHVRTKMGIVQIPEGRKLFSGMDVQDNLLMGAYTRSDKAEVAQDLERVFSIFPELVPLRSQLAGSLSGGQQQMVAIGRGLMSKPTYLFIDEMSLGVAPVIVDRLVLAIKEMQTAANMGIVIVEQDVMLALELASSAYVLETGRIVHQGVSADVASDPRITQAYLGI